MTNDHDETVGDAMVKLWDAMNEYHMASGGGVLSFDDFRSLLEKLGLIVVDTQQEDK